MKLNLKVNLSTKVIGELKEAILKEIQKTSKEEVEAIITKALKETVYENIVESGEEVIRENISAKITLEKGEK